MVCYYGIDINIGKKVGHGNGIICRHSDEVVSDHDLSIYKTSVKIRVESLIYGAPVQNELENAIQEIGKRQSNYIQIVRAVCAVASAGSLRLYTKTCSGTKGTSSTAHSR